MKKIVFIIPLLSSVLLAVTVGDATAAYGRLQMAIGTFTAATTALTQTQKRINKDLQKQIDMVQKLNYATAHSTEAYKHFSGAVSSYVDLQATNIKMGNIRNEAAIVYSKALNQILERNDIKILTGE